MVSMKLARCLTALSVLGAAKAACDASGINACDAGGAVPTGSEGSQGAYCAKYTPYVACKEAVKALCPSDDTTYTGMINTQITSQDAVMSFLNWQCGPTPSPTPVPPTPAPTAPPVAYAVGDTVDVSLDSYRTTPWVNTGDFNWKIGTITAVPSTGTGQYTITIASDSSVVSADANQIKIGHGSVCPTQVAAQASDTQAQKWTKYHNFFRCFHGQPLYTWDAALATMAQAYADQCIFAHSDQAGKDYGENLASGSWGPVDMAVQAWYDEILEPGYNAGDLFISGVGHYTQMIWALNTKVGCGYCPSQDISVCMYTPGGNINAEANYLANVPQSNFPSDTVNQCCEVAFNGAAYGSAASDSGGGGGGGGGSNVDAADVEPPPPPCMTAGMKLAMEIENNPCGETCEDADSADCEAIQTATQTGCASTCSEDLKKYVIVHFGGGCACMASLYPTPPPTAPAPPSTVEVEFTVANVNYDDLIANAAVKAAFEDGIKTSVAAQAGNSVTKDHVSVVLSAGSVKVQATVTVPAGADVSTLSTTLTTLSASGAFATAVATSVQAVPNIGTVSSGAITATAPTTVVTTPSPTPAPVVKAVTSDANVMARSSNALTALLAVFALIQLRAH